jgi:Subtilase family
MNQKPRVDAYGEWMHRAHLRENPNWIFLMLELRKPALAFAEQAAFNGTAFIRVPEHYRQPPQGLDKSCFCTAIVSPDFLQALMATTTARDKSTQQLIEAIKRFELGGVHEPWAVLGSARETSAHSRPVKVQQQSSACTVVVGVIDDGLAFANERFCRVQKGVKKTRFLALWDQDASPPKGASNPLWHHGQSHSQAQLNGYLSNGDENQAYAQAAYKAVKQSVAHGTHVLDLACGEAPHSQERMPDIVGVQLPLSTILDTSCASASPYILDGLRYVLRQADEAAAARGERCATVINLSFGDLAGPHDGSSLLERAFDELIALRRQAGQLCHIVMAAGNSYLSRCHARIALAPGQAATKTLLWHIQPDDATANFLELWPRLDGGGALDLADLEITLTPPRGGKSITLGGHATESRVSSADRPEALMALHPYPANGEGPMGLVVIAPTAHSPDQNPNCPQALAPCGDWTLTLHYRGQKPMVCQAYIQRDDISYGRPRLGRQSFFNDPAYERWDERGDVQLQDPKPPSAVLVRRCGTLNSLASGRLVDVVGSVDSQGKPAPYSSAQDLDAPTRQKSHHVMAVTDHSRARPGILAAGTRSSSVVALRGTSMAAPQLTRALAQGYLSGTEFDMPKKKVRDHDGHQRGLIAMTGEAQKRVERGR